MRHWIVYTSDKEGTGRKTRKERSTLGVIWFLLWGTKDSRVQINLRNGKRRKRRPS